MCHSPEAVLFESGIFRIGDRTITFVNTTAAVPDWGALGVNVVVECSGRATRRENAQAHLSRVAKKVQVSAGSRSLADCDAVLLPGINLDSYDAKKDHVVSMEAARPTRLRLSSRSCARISASQSGFFSTVHSYTNTQSLTDQPMADRRDSWAAAANIIPSSSGAAKALRFIWPYLPVTGQVLPGSNANGKHCRTGRLRWEAD